MPCDITQCAPDLATLQATLQREKLWAPVLATSVSGSKPASAFRHGTPSTQCMCHATSHWLGSWKQSHRTPMRTQRCPPLTLSAAEARYREEQVPKIFAGAALDKINITSFDLSGYR